MTSELLYEGNHIIVRRHTTGDVTICTGRTPSIGTPAVVDAEGLRDALDEYLTETEGGDDEDSGASVTDLEVEVDVDLSDTREAIETLQADVEDLNVDIEGLRENLAALSSHAFGDADYDLPAPSPSDVREQADVEDDSDDAQGTDEDVVTMVPAEPLYDIATSVKAVDSENQEDDYAVGFLAGQDHVGKWLEDRLDELTEESPEETRDVRDVVKTLAATDGGE